MSRIFGAIIQNGYVVRDIQTAMRHWIEVLGVGPWFYVDRLPVPDFTYKGQPSAAHISLALANSGPLQVELIQQRNDEPSLYRDFLNAGHEGLQHLGYGTRQFEADLERLLQMGYTLGQRGTVGGRGPFAYWGSRSMRTKNTEPLVNGQTVGENEGILLANLVISFYCTIKSS
jgi:hypothetical protein